MGEAARNARPLMVGRVREKEILQSGLSKAIRGHGGLIMISGEAGIGKTKLTEELGAFARMTDCRFLVGRCLPHSAAPYLPFQEALRSDPAVDIRGMFDKGSGEAMFRVRQALFGDTDGRPVVLVLEDLHWADTATVQLLHYLARNLETERALVVGTFRPEDISFEVADGLYHPLFESMRSMRREGVCREISLGTLGPEEVAELLAKILGGKVQHKVVSAVLAEGEGNPLFTIECVHSLLAHGQLVSSEGQWAFRGEQMSIPSTVREVLLRRVERLPKAVRRVLEGASVLGLQFEVRVLSSLLNTRALEVLEQLEDAERQYYMVSPVKDDLFRFTHENLQKVIYESISEPRRREMHREAAIILRSVPRDLRRDGEIALHCCRGGVREECVDMSVSAGEGWLRNGGVYEAAPHFQRALKLTVGAEEHLIPRMRALEGMGDCHMALANYAEALACYEEFMRLGEEEARCARVLRKVAECWSPTRLGKGSSEQCRRYLDQAEGCYMINDLERGEILSVRTNLALWSGDFATADALSSSSEAMFGRAGENARLADQLCYHAWIHLSSGDVPKALEGIGQAGALYGEHRTPDNELELNRLRGEVLYHQGRHEEAKAAFEAVYRSAAQTGDRVGMCWSNIFRAFICLDQGNVDAASAHATSALEEAQESDSTYMECMALTALALVGSAKGEWDEALRNSGKAGEMSAAFSSILRTPVKGMALVAKGRALSMAGRFEEGNQAFDSGIAWLDGGMACLVHLAFSLGYYGESLQRQGRRDEAMEHYSRSVQIFHRLGNRSGEERCQRVLDDLRLLALEDISLQQASKLYAK